MPVVSSSRVAAPGAICSSFHNAKPLQAAVRARTCQTKVRHTRSPVRANMERNDASSKQHRRSTLVALAVVVASGAGSEGANALGFKKDLTPQRKKGKVPLEKYTKTDTGAYSRVVGLLYYDLKRGTGQVAQKGDRVAVHFDCKWKGITFVSSRVGRLPIQSAVKAATRSL
eukprot:scaffold106_cov380-Prasinococcus_capsulatus_cf.AAC.57